MHTKSFATGIIFCLIILVCLFSACEEDDKNTITADETEGWIQHDYFFRSDKILLNGQVTDNDYLITGLSTITLFDTTSLNPDNYAIHSGRALTSKPAIRGKYAMYQGNRPGRFNYCWAMSMGGGYSKCFDISHYDTTYSVEAYVPTNFQWEPIGALNDRSQFLTLITDPNRSNSICLIDLNLTLSDGHVFLNPVITRINLDSPINALYSHYIASYKNTFFVSLWDINGVSFQMINEFGEVTPLQGISSPILEFFNFQDTLFVITEDDEVYRSTNDGFSWELCATGFYWNANFFQVENDLCFSIYSQLAKIDFESGEIQELDNSGLEGHEITSVNQHNGYVWVTTLSGLFYKPVEDFYTYKTSNSSQTSNASFNMLNSENSLK